MLPEGFWVFEENLICKEKCGIVTKWKSIKNAIKKIKLVYESIVLKL